MYMDIYVAEKLRELEAPRLRRRFEVMMQIGHVERRHRLAVWLGSGLVSAGERLQRWAQDHSPPRDTGITADTLGG